MAITEPAKAGYALEISRRIDAPPALVFRMWSSKEHLVRWWGPKDFSATASHLDFRVGGAYRSRITGPDGKSYGMSGVYRVIEEPSTLVFTFAWDGENGQPADETLITVTFEPDGDHTRLTFRQEPFADAEARDSHESGWGECLDKLAARMGRNEQ